MITCLTPTILLPAAASISYAKWNPADIVIVGGGSLTLSNGNLTASIVVGAPPSPGVRSTIGKSAGKWYWEVHADSFITGDYYDIGIATSAETFNGAGLGTTTSGWGYVAVNGKLRNLVDSGAGATYTTGDVIGIALDMTTPQVQFYKNNVLQYTQALAAGTWFAAVSGVSTSTVTMTANFGATAFVYTPPAGYNSGLY